MVLTFAHTNKYGVFIIDGILREARLLRVLGLGQCTYQHHPFRNQQLVGTLPNRAVVVAGDVAGSHVVSSSPESDLGLGEGLLNPSSRSRDRGPKAALEGTLAGELRQREREIEKGFQTQAEKGVFSAISPDQSGIAGM